MTKWLEPTKAGHMIALSENNRGGLVPGWSDEDLDGAATDRFTRVAAAVPHHVALVGAEDDVYTFEELHDASARVAHAILDKVGPGSEHVALYAKPSVEGVVGMLGILAAGKAYLPFDPAEPIARATAKIENAEVRLIVAPGPLASAAASLIGRDDSVISLEDLPAETSGPTVRVHPDDRFNLIYTSGSTGVPKGVVQTHRNVLFDTAASLEMMHVDEHDRYGLVVPLTFGASVSDVMGALLNGAALHVLDLRQSGIDVMARWMHADAITVTHLVPTVFRRWMASIDEQVQYPAMRMVKAGGEPLLRRDLDAFGLHFGERCVLRNGLGTTETYLVAAELLTRDDVHDGPTLPVGYPVAGRSVAILGQRGEAMPAGGIGQIAVTSRYLSPGYWKDDAATSRVFLDDPDGDGERTYLTGDMGRIRPDGRLEHLGRMDDMVKIRGQRVDLSEVETLVLEQAGVAEVTVLAEAAPSGDNRLIAYMVPVADPPAASALRAGLARRLPPQMIPTRFVWMEQLPTLSFGKVDRRLLQDREKRRTDLDVEYVEPRDSDEEFIASCVATLLEVERVGVNDDLFDLGLSSLVGVQLIGRISEELGILLPIEAVFEAPSVAGLAAWAKAGSRPARRSLVAVRSDGAKTPFFCVHGGGGGVFFVGDIANHLSPGRPIYGLQAAGFDGGGLPPYRPVEELAARYLAEVRTVQPVGPYLLGGLSMGGIIAMQMASYLVEEGEEVALLALLDALPGYPSRDDAWQRHRGAITPLTTPQRLAYLARGAWRRLRRGVKRTGVAVLDRARRPLADTWNLRNSYYWPLHAEAAREYVVRPFPGRLTVIGSEGSTETQRRAWSPYAGDGVDVYEVESAHLEMTVSPHVEVLAQHLQRSIDDAERRLHPPVLPRGGVT